MLKANNSISTPQSPKISQPPVNPVFQEKLSKLSARKQKLSGDFARTSSANDLLTRSFTKNDMVEPVTTSRLAPTVQHIPLQLNETNSAENASRLGTPRSVNAVSSANHSSEVDALLKEKQHWLRTMHQDNGKMAQMLKVCQ